MPPSGPHQYIHLLLERLYHHVCRVQVIQRDWSEDWSDVSPPDVLLGADLLYDPVGHPPLVSLAKRLLARPPKPGTPTPVAYLAAQV